MVFLPKSSFLTVALLLGSAFSAPGAGATSPARDRGLHSVPLQRISTGNNAHLHPAVAHQQHTNRASVRLAKMTNRAVPSEADLATRLYKRIASLPSEHRKRSNMGELFDLLNMPAVQSLKSAASAAAATQTSASPKETATDGYSETELEAYGYNALTPAVDPTFINSAGLDIVANDVGYLATLLIGTNPNPEIPQISEYRLLVDSGSSDLWVGSENCVGTDGGRCDRHNLLGPNSSTTFHDTKKTFVINYGSGNITGDVVTDNLSVAGLNLTQYMFGVATIESPQFTDQNTLFDGILGLATPSLSVVGGPTLVQALVSSGYIKDPIVSYYLDRSANATNHGEITFGGMDPSKYINGTATTFQNAVSGYWGAFVTNVAADKKTLSIANRTVILDTGTSLFVVPQADAEALHAAIPGAAYDSSLSSWTLPCTTKTVLSLTIAGKDFTIDPKDLLFLPVNSNDLTGTCLSAISVGVLPSADEWVLGDVFLKNVYFSTNVATSEVTLAQAL